MHLVSIFLQEDKNKYLNSAGVLIYCPKTDRYLVGLRSEDIFNGHTWSGFGGAIEQEESPEETIRREVWEELGYDGVLDLKPSYYYDDGHQIYHNYLGFVPKEFLPVLNWEADNAQWVKFEDLEKLKLHPGFAVFIEKLSHNRPEPIKSFLSLH